MIKILNTLNKCKKTKTTHIFVNNKKQWKGPNFEFTQHSSTYLGSETDKYFLSTYTTYYLSTNGQWKLTELIYMADCDDL